MDLPRVKAVTAAPGAVLDIEWRDGERSTVNLIGWITTGGSMLAPLRDPAIWATAQASDYGATVEWAGDDLAIDACHLFQIAEDQRDFDTDDLHRWQAETGLPNNEAADFLGVSLSTW